MDMFYQDEGGGCGALNDPPVIVPTAPRTSLTYEEVVRDLIASEKAYIKELHMLIKVFRYLTRITTAIHQQMALFVGRKSSS